MRDKSKRDSDCCHRRRPDKLTHAEPAPHSVKTSWSLPNFSQNVSGKKWRQRGLRKPAENIP